MTTNNSTSVNSSNLLPTLTPNAVYILLFHHPNPSIKYHWGFYHHFNSSQGGWKFDIINPGGVWKLAHPYGNGEPQLGVLDPEAKEPLGVMLRVGGVKDGERGRVHEVVREEDGRLNELNRELEGGISCRVYVMRACSRLREVGLVRFEEWEAVEREVLSLGEESQSSKGEKVLIADSRVANRT